MGGVYYSFTVILSQASCGVVAALYLAYYTGEEQVEASSIYAFIGGLQGSWFIVVLLFLNKIERKYLRTFYSTESGRQRAVSRFLSNNDDSIKMEVFWYHPDLWSDIKGEVKEYCLTNWKRWEAERPPWLDENLQSMVSDNFIPKESN